LPGLAEVILIGDRGTVTAVPGTRDWGATVAAQSSDYAIGPTRRQTGRQPGSRVKVCLLSDLIPLYL